MNKRGANPNIKDFKGTNNKNQNIIFYHYMILTSRAQVDDMYAYGQHMDSVRKNTGEDMKS